MIKTQVQIPDELFSKAKALAARKEISFAEVVRRGLEYVTRVYPEGNQEPWKAPVLRGLDVRWPLLDQQDYRDVLAAELAARHGFERE